MSDGSILHMTSKRPYPQDMEDALDKFRSDAEQIIGSWVKTLQDPPPIIYHLNYAHTSASPGGAD